MIRALADFLLARFEEEEADMKFTTSRGRWVACRNYPEQDRGQILHQPTGDYLGVMHHPADSEHAVRWQPSRIRAELDTKRAIVQEARDYSPELTEGDNGEAAFEAVLRHLAGLYPDHPQNPLNAGR